MLEKKIREYAQILRSWGTSQYMQGQLKDEYAHQQGYDQAVALIAKHLREILDECDAERERSKSVKDHMIEWRKKADEAERERGEEE